MNEPRVIESVTNECQLLGRAHESSSARAEQLIACLEGEIAKRDARIVEMEADLAGTQLRVLSLQDQWRNLDAELAAIKAQEPVQVDYVAVMRADGDGGLEVGWLLEGGTAELMNGMYLCCVGGGTLLFEEGSGHLYAAPVSEAKAQEPVAVVAWPAGSGRTGGFHSAAPDSIELEPGTKLYAAPVQQVSVPDGWKLVRNSGSIILKCEGQWSAGFSQYDSSTLSRNLWRLFDAMLNAAPAAPAADASDVLEQAMYTLISIGYHENSGLVHELRQALATNRAKGVV